jgi:beta-lactamase class A
MSSSARVTSVEAVKEFRGSLCSFGHDAKEALGTTDLEIRRILDWLDAKLKDWQREVGIRQEQVARAKAELMQRQYGQKDGRGPGTTDQEIALQKAIRRLQEAEAKVAKTRQWQNLLPRAVAEYEGPARQLMGMLDADLARGLAILDQKINALDAYLTSVTPLAPIQGNPGSHPSGSKSFDGGVGVPPLGGKTG